MRFKTAGVQLLQDGDGRVTGAIVKNMDDGTYAQVNASKGVVLSCGGYEMNPKMVEAWCRPEDFSTTSMSSTGTGSTGDGHMMGLLAGAGMDPLPHCTMSFGGGYPENGQFFHAFRDGIYVNARGERFVNEGLMFNFTASAINTNAYRGGVWTIIDQSFIDAMAEKTGTDVMGTTVKDYTDAGWMVSADTVEELADKIGQIFDRGNEFFVIYPCRSDNAYRPSAVAVYIVVRNYHAGFCKLFIRVFAADFNIKHDVVRARGKLFAHNA